MSEAPSRFRRFRLAGPRLAPGQLWNPVEGDELRRLLAQSGLALDARRQVADQARAVLGSSYPPATSGPGRRTGLVVGYVQSGKTMSFTAVTAMARDNGYQLVLLLGGTRRLLKKQTVTRLRQDLAVSRSGPSPWFHVDDLRQSDQDAAHLERVLRSGSSGEAAVQTAVVTAMKTGGGVRHLATVMRELRDRGAVTDSTSVLVVDDEADQAGLNTGADDKPSATFAAIDELRSQLPRHTYLMYTATPQAPLLLDLADMLSPDFVRVLEPGEGYTGGQDFFLDGRDRFVRSLSPVEAAAALDVEDLTPPDSLKAALATYLVGAASETGRTMAMLVHPSHTRDQHDRYQRFVRAVLGLWGACLGDGSEDAQAEEDDFLRPAWRDLHAGGAEVPPYDDCVAAVRALCPRVRDLVVNSDQGAAEVDWSSAPAWVLIGGNKLDRGFTVEGLSVTYMPRGTGVGNADTIQQRARFFGYKSAYSAFCKAWMTTESVEAYVNYVEHEQLLRQQLRQLDEKGLGLKQWKRTMVLDTSLRPCRRGVIKLPVLHSQVSGERWLRLERLTRSVDTDLNRGLVEAVVGGNLRWRRHPRETRAEDPNLVARVPLETVVKLLLSWSTHPQDRTRLNQYLLLLGVLLDDDPGAVAEVVHMRGGRSRRRSQVSPEDGSVKNLHEGRRPDGGYPGDAVMYDSRAVTVQVFSVDAVRDDERVVIGEDLPALALHLPETSGRGVLVEVGS